MSLSLAVAIYCAMIAVVSSLMTYYFGVMRPKEEQQLKGENRND